MVEQDDNEEDVDTQVITLRNGCIGDLYLEDIDWSNVVRLGITIADDGPAEVAAKDILIKFSPHPLLREASGLIGDADRLYELIKRVLPTITLRRLRDCIIEDVGFPCRATLIQEASERGFSWVGESYFSKNLSDDWELRILEESDASPDNAIAMSYRIASRKYQMLHPHSDTDGHSFAVLEEGEVGEWIDSVISTAEKITE